MSTPAPSASLSDLLSGGLDVLAPAASCGVGHLRAAQAVAEHVTLLRPDLKAQAFDLVADTPAWFRGLYRGGYNFMVSRYPTLFGQLYERTDRSNSPTPTRFERFGMRLQSRGLRHVLRALANHPPKVLVHTHYLLPPSLYAFWGGKPPGFKQAVCITDLELHRYWRLDGIDQWFVANDLCRAALGSLGIDRRKVDVVGIPLMAAWATPADPGPIRRELQLEDGRAVVLMSAGAAFVSKGFETMVDACLAALPEAHHVLLVGRNKPLADLLERKRPRHPLLRIVPFTLRMPELMAAASVLVTKPGGLTTSEALCAGLPMVLVNPVPGQEQANSDLLLTAGTAVRANHPRMLPIVLSALLGDRGRLGAMRAAALAHARPKAADAVAQWAISAL